MSSRIITLVGLLALASQANQIPWRVAAERVRHRNRRASATGRSERYAVDSDTLMCAVLRGDKLLWANDCYRRTLGYRTLEELYATPIWDYIAPESQKKVLRRMDRLKNTVEHSRQTRYTFQGPNGKRLNLIMHTVDTWDDGGVMCRACVAGEEPPTWANEASVVVRHQGQTVVLVGRASRSYCLQFIAHYNRLQPTRRATLTHPTEPCTAVDTNC